MLKHLQDQLSDAQITTDQLAALKVKEQLYKTQMEQLRGELEEAKKNHTPVSCFSITLLVWAGWKNNLWFH